MTGPLRLVVMGSTGFVLPSLDALRRAGHEVVCVYTRPPRPKGRGHKVHKTPVQERAEALGIEVRTPRTLKDPGEQAAFRALAADLAVTGAYGLLLPPAILGGTRLGCVNLHASILPRWRGAAPIERAILAGDTETGISLFVMDEGLDTGPLLAVERIAIGADEDAASLHARLAALAAAMVVPVLEGYAQGRIVPVPQPEAGACYAAKIDKAESRIDWAEDAAMVLRRVRALPAWTVLDGTRLQVLAARAAAGAGAPGTVVRAPLVVACGSGAVELLRVRREGAAALDAAAFLRGRPVPPGTRLG